MSFTVALFTTGHDGALLEAGFPGYSRVRTGPWQSWPDGVVRNVSPIKFPKCRNGRGNRRVTHFQILDGDEVIAMGPLGKPLWADAGTTPTFAAQGIEIVPTPH